MSAESRTPSVLPVDPKVQQAVAALRDLKGRVLENIEVVPLGVMFHFGSKNGDAGVVYWAYGGPK